MDPSSEVLDLISQGLAFLAASGEDLSICVIWFKRHNVADPSSRSAQEWRREALGCFRRAAISCRNTPCDVEPWLWFQIGWYSFAYDDGPCDLEVAQDSLQRALALESDNGVIHLALTLLLYQHSMTATDSPSKSAETAWDGEAGKHLRTALDSPGPLDEFCGRSYYISSPLLMSGGAPLGLFVNSRTRYAMMQGLDALDDAIPDNYRFRYSYVYSLLACDDKELSHRWKEEAIRWPSGDDTALVDIHYGLARYKRGKGDVIGSYENLISAYEHLRRLDVAEHWFAYESAALNWRLEIAVPGSDVELPQRAIPLFLKLVDGGLDLVEPLVEVFSILPEILGYPGEMAAVAGQLLLDSSNLEDAKRYLRKADQFEAHIMEALHEQLNWDDDFDGEFEWDWPSGNDWRVVKARAWRDIHIVGENLDEAKKYNDRILELSPGDANARNLKLPLMQRAESRQRHMEAMEQVKIVQRQNKQLRQEVSLQRDAVDRLARSREDYFRKSDRQLEALESFLEQFHTLAQEASKIQPAAWKRAYQRLSVDLGPDLFDYLHRDAQHFLITAEVFFHASQHVPGEMDWGLIVVEYAKVVET